MIEAIWLAAFNGPLNQGFSIAILGLTTLSLVGLVTTEGVLARLPRVAPGILTATGVLGTFVGILAGLLQFDVTNISGSVPGLLEGMKTAFVTSVFGTAAGLSVKLATEIFARSDVGTASSGGEDAIAILRVIATEARTGRLEMVASIDKVRNSLSGDSESSLITQMQRLRTDITDEIKEVRRDNAKRGNVVVEEIQKISTKLSEDTTQAFVKALEGAIRDFNEKISEQFGENFKHLNVAVGRLLDWQENYRTQMAANAEALREGASAIQASSTSLTAISEKADALVEAATTMQSLLDGFDKSRADLDLRLKSFSSMASAAEQAVPLIQKRLEDLTQGFAEEVERALSSSRVNGEALQNTLKAHAAALKDESGNFVKTVGEAANRSGEAAAAAVVRLEQTMLAATTEAAAALAAQQKSFDGLASGFDALRKTSETSAETLRGAVVEAGAALNRSIAETSEKAQTAASEIARAVAQQLQRTADEEFTRIAGSLDGQVKALDKAMQDELTKAISALGSQLASLSRQFVDDYTPLTAQLRNLVEVARRATPV